MNMKKNILMIKSKIWSDLSVYIKLGILLMIISVFSMISGTLLGRLVISNLEHYTQGKPVFLFITLYGGVITLVSAICTLILLDIYFFKRIYNLNREIKKIEYAKDLSARLAADGNDEISLLAKNINKILEIFRGQQSKNNPKE